MHIFQFYHRTRPESSGADDLVAYASRRRMTHFARSCARMPNQCQMRHAPQTAVRDQIIGSGRFRARSMIELKDLHAQLARFDRPSPPAISMYLARISYGVQNSAPLLRASCEYNFFALPLSCCDYLSVVSASLRCWMSSGSSQIGQGVAVGTWEGVHR